MKAEIVNSNCCRQKIAHFIAVSLCVKKSKIQNLKSKIDYITPFFIKCCKQHQIKESNFAQPTNLTLPTSKKYLAKIIFVS
jgi:hypothetical protein